MLYDDIHRMTLKARASRLTQLQKMKETPETQHEMAVLRVAIKPNWSPDIQRGIDEAHRKTKPKAPTPTVSTAPTPRPVPQPGDVVPEYIRPAPPVEPVTKDVHVTVNIPPSTGSSSYIPSTTMGAVVHFAEKVLDVVTTPSPRQIASKVAASINNNTSTPPQAHPTARTESPMSTKSHDEAAPSTGINIDSTRLIKSVAGLILAAGIIGVMLWQLGAVEFLNILLYVFLPVFALLCVWGLVKYSVLELVWNLELKERVGVQLEEMRRRAVEAPASRATA